MGFNTTTVVVFYHLYHLTFDWLIKLTWYQDKKYQKNDLHIIHVNNKKHHDTYSIDKFPKPIPKICIYTALVRKVLGLERKIKAKDQLITDLFLKEFNVIMKMYCISIC